MTGELIGMTGAWRDDRRVNECIGKTGAWRDDRRVQFQCR
jgi:hypothetical protein